MISRKKDELVATARDIDYAAVAVKTAIVEKFGRKNDLADLKVIANERTISIEHGDRRAEGTRDDLLAALRRSGDYSTLWQELPTSNKPTP
jgi:hypothetical protein